MKLWPVVTGVAIALTLVACKSPTPPKGVQPISGFDASRYLGKWYEVARLENRFERGLEQVTATYGARSDGGISVVNRGYDPVKKRWNESDGKAYFTGAPTTAALKADPAKFYKNMDRHGNTSAASIPVALNELAENGQLQPGQLLACIGFGGGLTWGGAIFQYKE